MLYRAQDILREGSKELGGNRIRTADSNCTKGYSIPYDIMQKEFWRRWEFISFSSAAQGASWALVREWWQSLVHHLLYTLIHRYIVITIILILFNILVISFISTLEFYLFFPDSPPHPTGKGGSEQTTVWCWATCRFKPQQGIWDKRKQIFPWYYRSVTLVLYRVVPSSPHVKQIMWSSESRRWTGIWE